MRAAFWACAVAAALTAFPAAAQPADELARVKQEAAQLRQYLEQLDARIRALESGSPAPPAAAGAARTSPETRAVPPDVVVLRSWSEIQRGTSKAQVDALLGKPEREMRLNGDLVWYYLYPGLGRGSVFFTREEKVSAVQPPKSGWAW